MAFHSDVLCDKATVWHASAVNYCIIVEQIFENMFKLKCYDTAQEDGFQAHISHLVDLVPKQPCLSRPKTEQLHISILSQLLVGRAILEAQAQLRLESLQRYWLFLPHRSAYV